MEPIPKSGSYYPNKAARISIQALEEVMGKNGINVILNMANLPDLTNELPPNDLEKQFDFADFSSISGALDEMYGPRGGRGLALRAGRATFNDVLKDFGALAGVGDVAFKVLPMHTKMKLGLSAMAKIFSQISDQVSTFEEFDDHYLYVIHKCPVCWGRHTDKPACFLATGLLHASTVWVSGGKEFKIVQTTAKSTGDETCNFVIMKEPVQ
ncbi:MAG: 4-vinyl reductase [Anaerolineaceae bacterium]|nr:4-vinyl reductase [Anaerolineaceae bacterium]